MKNPQFYQPSRSVLCSLVPADEDHCRMEEEKEKPEDWRGTVLEKVLSSLCSYHRPLLYHILQDMREDYSVALALRDAHRRLAKTEPLCSPAERSSPSDALPCSLSSCTAGCLTACGFRTCAVGSVCICMKNLACQNLALGCVGKVICSSAAVCCAHHKMLGCQQQCSHENVCIAHASNVLGVQMKHASVLHSHNACQTCRSPSPPPLSPVALEIEYKTGSKYVNCKGQESVAQSKPPPLLPHRTETSDEDDKAQQSGALHAVESSSVLVKDTHSKTKQEEIEHNCGTILGEIMDEFNEKLKNIQPSEREQTPQTPHAVQQSNRCDDTQLTEIITTVLHSSSDKEYNLKELFEQRMATERQSPQTRSRRRQEVLAALSLSPDLPASRRQSLQIKRDLARLDPSACRRKLEMDRGKCPKNSQPHISSTSSVKKQSSCPENVSKAESIKQLEVDSRSNGLPRLTSEKHNHQEQQEKQPADLTKIQLCNELDLQQPGLSDKKSNQDKKCKMFQPDNNVGRCRRNIVPPQRFSSYVTEPRKMFYAACFSEGLFIKHSQNVSTTSECDSAKICTTKHPIKSEVQGRARNPSSHEMNVLTVSPRKIRTCEDSKENDHSEQTSKIECEGEHKSPSKKLRSYRSKNLTKSQSPELVLDQSVESNSQESDSKALTYASPIKLMLVSCVKSEDGVKYTLKAADSGSNPNGEMFDPCVEASWAGSSINKQTQKTDVQKDLVQNDEFNIKPPEVIPADEVDLISPAKTVGEASPAVQETTPVKRRPGRPKKLGPQIEKLVKRPIGRPPKVKTGDPSSLNSENENQKTIEKTSTDDSNKNLKITILYGRSRKARRVVSEDMKHVSLDQQSYEVQSSADEIRKMNTGGEPVLNLPKIKLEGLHFVKPVEDRKGFIHASSNIKCQKQSDLAVMRKPGRPAKVKISGISVTVTTVSPRQRKIHMKKDMKESQRRALVMEFEPSKEQKTINEHTDVILNDQEGTMEESTEHSSTSFVPVRHSIRERKPSVHFLHSVATARSFSRSNALVCRSHKLLMGKTNPETTHQMQREPEVAANKSQRKRSHRVGHIKNAVRFSGVSVDSIFALDESFKWWSTSASPEILNKELARRIRLMSDTWVSDVLEAKKSEEVQMKQKPKDPDSDERSSAVRMLFKRNYNMEKLSSWFMQTTETQSLSIVKKASARNPCEIFQYSPVSSTSRENVCPSPQAERLRKHVKKFAQIVPKSPSMHRQALIYKARRSFVKHLLFNSSKINTRHVSRQKRTPKTYGSWGIYKTALLRARSKFPSNSKKTSTTKVQKDLKTHKGPLKMRVETTGSSKEPLQSVNEVSERVSENKLPQTDTFEQEGGFTGTVEEERISSKAWSPEKLKECRVFLKKINSPSSTSVTVHTVSPAGCYVPMKEEKQKDRETAKLQKTFYSPRKSHSTTTTPSKSGEKRRSFHPNESSSAKRTRQSRSSRGVLAAKWCDFVIGPPR